MCVFVCVYVSESVSVCVCIAVLRLPRQLFEYHVTVNVYHVQLLVENAYRSLEELQALMEEYVLDDDFEDCSALPAKICHIAEHFTRSLNTVTSEYRQMVRSEVSLLLSPPAFYWSFASTSGRLQVRPGQVRSVPQSIKSSGGGVGWGGTCGSNCKDRLT